MADHLTKTFAQAKAESAFVRSLVSWIDADFWYVWSSDRPAFVAYVTAGYPESDDTVSILLALERGGADIIELGIPLLMGPLSKLPVMYLSICPLLFVLSVNSRHFNHWFESTLDCSSTWNWLEKVFWVCRRGAKCRTQNSCCVYGILESVFDVWRGEAGCRLLSCRCEWLHCRWSSARGSVAI